MKLWKFLLLLLGLALVVGAGLVAVNFLVLPALVHGHQVVIMPDLRNMDLNQAREEVHAMDIGVQVTNERPHPSLGAGQILDQNPAPGARVRGGRVVKVVISSGPPTGQLAALIGLTPQQAEVTLQRENFRRGRVVYMPRVETSQPVVAYQSPQAGVVLAKGRAVSLVVAQPAPPVKMRLPDLTGMPLYQVRQMISAAGLVLVPVQYQHASTVAPNHILSQEPKAGSRVGKGDSIVLVVATG